MTRLYFTHGPLEGESFDLNSDITYIGRASENDIRIPDKTISRKHAKISMEGDKIFIEDLRSQNGTWIYGNPINPGERYEVEEGLPIAIGANLMTIGEEYSKDGIITQYSISLTQEIEGGKRDPLYKNRRITDRKRLELIYEISTILMQSLDIHEISDRIMEALFSCFIRIDSGVILLVDKDSGRFEEIISRARNRKEKVKVNYSRTIVNRAIREGKAIMILDTRDESKNDLSESIEIMRIKSIMCIPMISKEGTEGVIYVHSINVPYGFRKDDFYLLTGLSTPAALAIMNARLYSKRKLAEEALQKAHDELEMRIRERTAELAETNKELQAEIGERIRTEEVLSQSEKRYRFLVENTLDGYFISEIPSGSFLFLNQRICDLYGCTMSEGAELDIWNIISLKDHLKVKERIQSCLKGEDPGYECHIYEAVRRDGSTFRAEMSTSFAIFQGQRVMQGVFRDVTEQVRLQQQLQHAQKMESIGTISSGVAHNFRNILASILVNGQLIQMKYEDDLFLQDITRRIVSDVERGSRLVMGLTQFSRKKSQDELQILNLSTVIRETYRLITGAFDKKIDIHIDIPEKLHIMGDSSGLSQVIMNLFTNARDAMPSGGKLVIKAGSKNDKAFIIISDTGHGMDKETMNKCFDPFFTTKEVNKGTGLGLSTAYGIVKEQGGEIRVYSEPDKGTEFKIYFPLAQPEGAGKGKPLMKIIHGKGQKIMVVDDEVEMLKPVEAILNGLGYSVASITKGKTAIDKYKSWHPDVILMDRNMPVMDGVSCAKRILDYDPDARILIVSGYEEKGPNGINERTRALIKGYLTKPIGVTELSHALARVLESRNV